MEISDNARVASWYLSKIADSKDNSEINSNPLGFREALVDILCSHTDLRVDNSQMIDEIAELREALGLMVEHFDKYNSNIENISNLSYLALKSKQLLNK